MRNKNIVMAGIVLSVGLFSSCGTRTDRGVIDGENTRSTTNRANTGTTTNRVNTSTGTPTRTTTTTDRVNTTAASNRVNQNTTQNHVSSTTDADLKNTPTTDRLHESATSKQHMDDNATLNRRNDNAQTVERMEKRDDIHNANQDDKVQQTAAANSRKILYTQLNMSQDQIQKMESMMHNQNNPMSESAQTQSPRDRQLRTDKYFKEILDEEQFTRYERWKNENPNTWF